MHGPSPLDPHPMPGQPRVTFLKPVVDRPNITIGDYTYYDDPDEPERFAETCVLYHYDFIGDRLVIGRFCAIATGVRFVMNGANHALGGLTTFPFQIFGQGWEEGFDPADLGSGCRGDTIVGNDVWIGREAMIMPGSRIGDGSVIGARAVVSGAVPPYSVVVGNPGRVVRRRFDDRTIARLLALGWWDWDAEKITRHLALLRSADIDALERAARQA
ncbi:CatB-related O-acetyltransferase [Propylenella binzhouense]|uniref:CatB-related O-acetyltransferase n=1 Tax=Propylenella binzhouense TaxID=2555902 RepID=A0A964T9B6_9HYPH|nr:CatB-related O-acetyltransferase [Propylenella binzhouense]MYZ50440.1 CatB-related O-acetyltransferase [Propylenella binzhouense]